MKLLWFTARSFSDLCSTTQYALIKGLLSKGFEVQLLNGDQQAPLENNAFTHIPLSRSLRRGFQASSLAKEMVEWLKNNSPDPSKSMALVEWRVARWVAPVLNELGVRWFLVDRSPPADSGVFGWLQWSVWKNAWKGANRENIPGFVVSSAHQVFVERKTTHKNTFILPAGVDLNLFKPTKKHDVLTMVYHGRLDEHRGLMAAIMFTHKARQAGIQVNLKMIGEGNIEAKLEGIAAEYDYIEMKPKMQQSKVAQEIGACHIGLLPMPERTAWAIASPLKRSEYLASGLCVFGIDHEGHRLEGSGPWMKLVKQEDFHEQGLAYLRTFKNNSKPLFQGARAYAEEHAGWDIAISNLIEALQ